MTLYHVWDVGMASTVVGFWFIAAGTFLVGGLFSVGIFIQEIWTFVTKKQRFSVGAERMRILWDRVFKFYTGVAVALMVSLVVAVLLSAGIFINKVWEHSNSVTTGNTVGVINSTIKCDKMYVNGSPDTPVLISGCHIIREDNTSEEPILYLKTEEGAK